MTTPPRPLSAKIIAVPDRHWRQLGACRHADPELFFPVSASGGYLRVLLVLHDGFVGGHLANTSCMIIHEGIAPETHYFAADRVERRWHGPVLGRASWAVRSIYGRLETSGDDLREWTTVD
jgi:hypothetical protein